MRLARRSKPFFDSSALSRASPWGRASSQHVNTDPGYLRVATSFDELRRTSSLRRKRDSSKYSFLDLTEVKRVVHTFNAAHKNLFSVVTLHTLVDYI